jgi:hypothetical protein
MLLATIVTLLQLYQTWLIRILITNKPEQNDSTKIPPPK